jgi:Icc-related predicted phosphoesterase
MTNISIISDVHGNIEKYNEVHEETNLVIIPGDLFAFDSVEEQKKEVPEFARKIDEMFPHASDIIVVPGNHDYLLERVYNSWNTDIEMRKLFGYKYTLLVDRDMMFINLENGETLKIYGNPRTNLGMAFPRLWGGNDIKRIPLDLDILITHEAPRLYSLDCIKESVGMYGDGEPGNQELYERVSKVKPKYHIFGHIHRPEIKESSGTIFINASQMNRNIFKPDIKNISV